MTGPNFYSIDFSREQVLQGKSTTFITIGRNDSVLGNNALYVLVFPHARTFDAYATADAKFTNSLTGTQVSGVELTTSTYPNTNELSFSNVQPGMFVKNSHDYANVGPTGLGELGPILVGNTGGTGVINIPNQPGSYITDLSGVTGSSIIIEPSMGVGVTGTMHVGFWDENANERWSLNGKSISEYEYISYTTPWISSQNVVSLKNLFDGTVENFSTNFLEGTGFVGRKVSSGLGGAVRIAKDNNVPNASATLRIDYDGVDDSHLKFNMIIISAPPAAVVGALTPPLDTLSNNTTSYGLKSAATLSTSYDYQEVHFMGYKETSIRPTRTTWQNDYKSEIKVYDDRSSYGVLKTNPKLSGNVKITLDSTGNLWLNSIDANNELADSAYKKYAISPLSTYARDLYKFFKNGQTPTSIIFDLYQTDNQYENTKRTLAEQYDNFYNYGVEQLKSKYYDEGFSFFAPLWLRKVIPDYFIIFRLDHPLSVESYMSADNTQIYDSFFKDARIVKTFDMRETSKLGSYLRKIVNDPRYKERPLDVSFDTDIATTWNGISYVDGTMTGKGEFLNDYYTKDRPIIEFEEYITGGFERQGIISTNLVNLEFLFDDSEAAPYSINRYFGLYVTENQLANFEIDPISLAKIPNQTPIPKAGIDGQPYSTKEFVQTNPEGIQIPVHYYHNPTSIVNNTNVPTFQGEVVGKFPLPSLVEDPLRIFYIKDRNDAFKRITELKEVDYGNPGTEDYRRVSQLKLFDTQEDISNYAGVNQITSQFDAKLLDKGYSQLRLHLAQVTSDPVFADEEELELTINTYVHGPRLHTYYLKTQNVSPTNVSFTVFKDQYTRRLGSSLTMPAVGGTLSGVFVNEIDNFFIGQQVYITTPGLTINSEVTFGSYFTVTGINPNILTIDIVNDGNPTNVAPLTLISVDELISTAGPTYNITYNYNPLSNNLAVDTLLSLQLEPLTSYTGNESYRIDVNSTELNITFLGGTLANLTPILMPSYQQFRWRMIAKSTGMQAGDAWDYPIADPNGYDYISTFSNEGTATQVASALAKCINTFENGPCYAVALGEEVYLKAKRPGLEGNAIQLTRRMVNGESLIFNLGFFEKGNIDVNTSVNVEVASNTNYDLPVEIINNTGIAGDIYYYLEISKTIGGSAIKIRTDVNPTNLITASTTGDGYYYVTVPSLDVFSYSVIPFSVNMSNLPINSVYEYIIKVSTTPNEIKQLFIGGVQRERNRARIGYVDSQRYFADRSVKLTGNIISGSKVITNVLLDNLYVGAKVTGKGIPNDSYITYIDYAANAITISNAATLGTTTSPVTTVITSSELSILNLEKIQDQWYQAQKGKYSPMKGWEVQGKYVYSLPYLEEPVFNEMNDIVDFTNLNQYSVIQLNDSTQEFYQTGDKRVVAYNIYRPILGIFSIFPVKEFDFDFYFSDYSYTPILEALRYYFNETLQQGGELILPADENYLLSFIDEDKNPVNTNAVLDIYGLNPNTKEWNKIEEITFNGASSGYPTELILNTYYPFYVYDEFEHPRTWEDAPSYFPEGVGLRNYMRRRISVTNDSGAVTEAKPLSYKIVVNSLSNTNARVKIVKNDYYFDKDLKTFSGFSAISDLYSPEDAEAIRGLLNDELYVDAFLRQSLRSEYDRLRENFNKDYALKSKVVPYINKWVQEGTDARDNYYRLNISKAFGITNFSPDTSVKFAEPSLLTNEFPYLDTVPKDYPTESLEGSRSYMFAKLSDIAKGNSTWYDLLTSDDTDDWFTKYFALGYPNEINDLNELITKSRDERYTFMQYSDGVKRSQTLFRGAKVQVIDINNALGEEVSESKKYNDYKFASIARIVPVTPLLAEKPVDIEVYRNDKFKSIVMIINIHIQDYRVQSGLNDYLFFYAMNDQLKNINQKQVPLGGLFNSGNTLASQDILSINQFLPYAPTTTSYEDLSILRPRQGFLGGGYLELGDTRIGGYIIDSLTNSLKPVFNGGKITMNWEPIKPSYNFSVINEIVPTYDNYTNKDNAFTVTGGLNVVPTSFTKDGSLFKLIEVVKLGSQYRHIDRTNSRIYNDSYLPVQTTFGGSNNPIYSSITPGSLNIVQFLMTTMNVALSTINPEPLETYNIKGGTSAYLHIKNLLTYASIKELVNYVPVDNNAHPSSIEYYKVENNTTVAVTDYRLQFIDPDQIIKTGVLAYVNDEDKPIEYLGAANIGYNIVDTNQNEVIYRHRGSYEPRANDVLSFWVREDETFTKHFEKDYLLVNTHFNDKSSLTGILRNYGINKVADAEILKIARGSAYKSVYPLVGEVSVDTKEQFVLNSTWDKNYYRKYYDTQNWNPIDGFNEMKEFKSFLGSKVMNIPNTHILDTFLDTEATFTVTAPSEEVGVKLLSKKEIQLTDVEGTSKPTLTVNLDLRARLLRKLLDDIELPTSFDEFDWLTTLGITELQSLTTVDIENLKKDYLNKNIIQLYEIGEIKLYALSEEGIPIFDITLDDIEKADAGYRVDKDCKVINIDEFTVRIDKQLDTKKPFGYSVTAIIKRI
jgi:hypothetical protein